MGRRPIPGATIRLVPSLVILAIALTVLTVFPTTVLAKTAANTIAATQNLDSTKTAANHWQVVSGEYAGNEAKDKTTFTGDAVRAQKNVVATDTENEFLIYESIDVKQRFADYFESATYEATTANDYHGEKPGTVVDSMEGNLKVKVTGRSGVYSNHGTFSVLSSNGELLASDITLYWSQANNVTFYLKVDDSHYVLVGVKIRNGSANTVQLSEPAEKLIMSKVAQYANISSVADEMGPNIEYVETVSCNGSTSFDKDSNTLTWIPTSKQNPTIDKVKTDESTTVTFTEDGKVVRTEKLYKYDSWALNVSELVYKVRLTPAVSTGLSDPGDNLPGTDSGIGNNLTNGTATVNWEGGSGDLISPVVRGMLYEIKFKKIDDASPAHALEGAEFTLYSDEACTKPVTTAINTATSTKDKNGDAVVDFANLQYGTYYLKETKAPAGYKADTTITPYVLCYTTDSNELVGQGFGEEALYGEREDGKYVWTEVVNPKLIEFSLLKVNALVNSKVLADADFVLYRDDGDRVFSKDADTRTEFTGTTDDSGRITFSGLDRDTDDADATYWIVEVEAPDGYALPDYTKVAPTYISIRVDEDGRLFIFETNADATATGTYNVKDEKGNTLRTIPSVTVKDRPRAVRVIKTAGDSQAALPGAEFTLYTDEACTTEVQGLYTDASFATPADATQATDNSGALTWYGLPAGTYYLKETRVPAGYQLYEKTIQLDVAADGTVTASIDLNGNGVIEAEKNEISTLNVDDDKLDPAGVEHGLAGVDDKVPYLTVSDPANPDMPSTGSSGHLLMTILGVCLISGGATLAAWLVRRKGSVAVH